MGGNAGEWVSKIERLETKKKTNPKNSGRQKRKKLTGKGNLEISSWYSKAGLEPISLDLGPPQAEIHQRSLITEKNCWSAKQHSLLTLFLQPFTLLTLLLSAAYTTWGVTGRKRRLSAARRNAWAGGMLYRDSVSLTLLIQVFWGRPLALRPLNLVLYVRWAGCWIGSLVRCPNHLILCCWIWWWMLFVPIISLILVLGTMSLLVLLTAFFKHLISQVVILRSSDLVVVQVWHWYVSVGMKMEFLILLFVSIGISECFSSGASW